MKEEFQETCATGREVAAGQIRDIIWNIITLGILNRVKGEGISIVEQGKNLRDQLMAEVESHNKC